MTKFRWNPFLRYPRFSLAACLLFLIPCSFKLLDFRISSESDVLLEHDQRNYASFEKVMDILGADTVVIVNMDVLKLSACRQRNQHRVNLLLQVLQVFISHAIHIDTD